MTQPTLAHVPGILFRTTMRLIARLVFLLAILPLIVGVAMTLASLLLATWRTPRSRRVQLAVDIVLLATELAKERWRVSHTESPVE